MISPLIKWEHSRKAYVKTFDLYEGVRITDYNKTINLKDVSWSFINGHVIDGKFIKKNYSELTTTHRKNNR